MPAVELLEEAALARLVAMAGHLATQRWSRYLSRAYGLSPGGAAVLMTLHRDRRLMHNEVADRCAVRAATLTGVVDTLVRSGHVERISDEDDRRAVWINLTGKGLAVAAQLQRIIAERRAITSVETEAENEAVIRRYLIELITRLSENEEPHDSGSGSTRPGQEVPEGSGQRGRSTLLRG